MARVYDWRTPRNGAKAQHLVCGAGSARKTLCGDKGAGRLGWHTAGQFPGRRVCRTCNTMASDALIRGAAEGYTAAELLSRLTSGKLTLVEAAPATAPTSPPTAEPSDSRARALSPLDDQEGEQPLGTRTVPYPPTKDGTEGPPLITSTEKPSIDLANPLQNREVASFEPAKTDAPTASATSDAEGLADQELEPHRKPYRNGMPYRIETVSDTVSKRYPPEDAP